MQLLRAYVRDRDLGMALDEKAMVSLTRNDYEPDVVFFGREKAARIEGQQMRLPPPDFVAEVLSPSTEKTDRTTKREDYAAHGVAEYWIIDPDDGTLEQYVLQDETYTLHAKLRTGAVESTTIEGFAIPIRALFDDAENLAALRMLLG